VAAPDGGPALLQPVLTRGQSILRTFSRTTTLERTTELLEVRLDPADFAERKAASLAGDQVMVRDTDQGVRYLEKKKDGERVVVDDAKTSRLFGLGGVFYDDSFDYPLPLLGVYYIDLDAGRRRSSSRASGAARSSRARTTTRTSSGRTSTSGSTRSRT
jgi:hypothetical protein